MKQNHTQFGNKLDMKISQDEILSDMASVYKYKMVQGNASFAKYNSS